MRSVLARKAGNEPAVHEKGWEEQGQGARVVADVRQRVGGARALDRPDDAVDGSSHAIAGTLSQLGEGEAEH